MSQNLGTFKLNYNVHLKTINFPFGIYGISKVLSVSILKHFRPSYNQGKKMNGKKRVDPVQTETKKQYDLRLQCFHKPLF